MLTRKKAYSLTELMVALALAAFVMAGGIYFLTKTTDSVTEATVYTSLQQRANTAFSALADDIETAVKVSGSSSAEIGDDGTMGGISGVMRMTPNDDGTALIPAPPRDASEEYDIILIRRFVHGDFRAEIDRDSYNVQAIGGTFRLLPPATIGGDPGLSNETIIRNNNTLTFVYEALEYYDIFYVSNTLASNLLLMQKLDGEEDDYAVEYAHIPSPITEGSFSPGDFDDPRTTVTPTTDVVWFVTSDGTLTRLEGGPDGQRNEFATKVSKFHVDFSFANKRKDRSLPIIVPESTQLLSHPRDKKYIELGETNEYGEVGTCVDDVGENFCLNPELENGVEYQDTLQAYVTLSINEDVDENFVLSGGAGSGGGGGGGYGDASAQMGFSLEGDNLKYTAQRVILPFSRNASSEEIAQQGADVSCTITNPDCRCREATSFLFQNPVYGAPDWIGYGQYVPAGYTPGSWDPDLYMTPGHMDMPSPYCIAGTDLSESLGSDDRFTPPESPEGRAAVPGIDTPPYSGGTNHFETVWNDTDNERLIMVARHFGGHQMYAWKWKWKVFSILNNAFINKFNFVKSQRNSKGYYTWAVNGENWDSPWWDVANGSGFDQLYQDYLNDVNNWRDRLKCHLNEDYNDKEYRQSLVSNPDSMPGARGLTKAQPWLEKCACMEQPRYRCHHGRTLIDQQDPLRCPSWEGEWQGGAAPTPPYDPVANKKVYIIDGVSLANPSEAGECQCYAETFNDHGGAGTPLPLQAGGTKIPTSHGHFYSFYWDFRESIEDDPEYASALTHYTTAPANYLTYMSSISHDSTPVQPDFGSAQQPAGTYTDHTANKVHKQYGQRYRNQGSWRLREVDYWYRNAPGDPLQSGTRVCDFGSFSSCVKRDNTFHNRDDLTNDQKLEAYAQIRPEYRRDDYPGGLLPASLHHTDLSSYCHPQCKSQREYDPTDDDWGGNNGAQQKARPILSIESRMAISCHKDSGCATEVVEPEDLPGWCSLFEEEGGLGGSL